MDRRGISGISNERIGMDNKTHSITYVREGIIRSILMDTFTFGSISAFLWFNYNYLGNQWIFSLFFVVSWIATLYSFAKGTRKVFYSDEELIKYLKERAKKK